MVDASPVKATINPDHHNNFNIIRLLLAVMVVFGHFKGLPGNSYSLLYSYADFAIHAFFVVSGYLIAMSYARGSDLINFYIRRVFRIYPLYLVIIIVQAIIMLMFLGDVSDHIGGTAWYLGMNAIFANFMAYDIGGLLSDFHNKGINASLWTLKIEMGFYLIVPAVWLLLRRTGLFMIIAIFAVSSAYHFYFEDIGRMTLAKQLPGQMRFFIVGIAFYKYHDLIKINTKVAIALSLVLFVACTMLRYEMWFDVIYPVLIGALVYLTAMRLPAYPLSFDFSYGIYLLHAPIIQISILLGVFADSWVYLSVLLVALFFLAYLAEIFIEKPGIAMGKAITRKRKEAKKAKTS